MGVINRTTDAINELLDKVEGMPSEGVVGKTPVLETGETITLEAGSLATSQVVANGTDSSGNPKYKLNFGIPKGQDGTSSSSGGGVADSVEWANVLNKPSWVNSSTKPSYTATEVGALPATTTIPSKTSQLVNDSSYTKTSSFKTVNGQSIVGSGNIEISGTGSGIADAPSDGNIYGRKNGEWQSISNTGYSVDVSDIFARLIELAEVGGTCSDEDYNKIKEYSENGVITYANISDTTLILDIVRVSGTFTLQIGLVEEGKYGINGFSIAPDKTVSYLSYTFLNENIVGQGKLGSYTKQPSYTAISSDDTITEAIGKLEAGLSSGGSGSNTYQLPSAILDLTEDSTSSDIKAALGGDDGINAIKAAVDNKSIFYIASESTNKQIIYVNVLYSSIGVYLSFSKKVNPVGIYTDDIYDVIIVGGLVNSCVLTLRYGVDFSEKLVSINKNSTTSDIRNALGMDASKLYKILSKKNVRNYCINFKGVNIPLSILGNDNGDGNYTFAISAISYGLWGTQFGGILLINYTLASNTYTADVVPLVS